jgi:hypothetical protein
LFEDYYMHQPTQADFDKQLAVNEASGFQRCLHPWSACTRSGKTA